MKREVLCTFSNGGQLIRAKESQLKFLKGINGRMVSRAIELHILSKSLQEYHYVVQNTLRMRRYNTGKQAQMLNELRMCFMSPPSKRRLL
jgi:hypothetical protein